MKTITYLASMFILIAMVIVGFYFKMLTESLLYAIGTIIILGINEICINIKKITK